MPIRSEASHVMNTFVCLCKTTLSHHSRLSPTSFSLLLSLSEVSCDAVQVWHVCRVSVEKPDAAAKRFSPCWDLVGIVPHMLPAAAGGSELICWPWLIDQRPVTISIQGPLGSGQTVMYAVVGNETLTLLLDRRRTGRVSIIIYTKSCASYPLGGGGICVLCVVCVRVFWTPWMEFDFKSFPNSISHWDANLKKG